MVGSYISKEDMTLHDAVRTWLRDARSSIEAARSSEVEADLRTLIDDCLNEWKEPPDAP